MEQTVDVEQTISHNIYVLQDGRTNKGTTLIKTQRSTARRRTTNLHRWGRRSMQVGQTVPDQSIAVVLGLFLRLPEGQAVPGCSQSE